MTLRVTVKRNRNRLVRSRSWLLRQAVDPFGGNKTACVAARALAYRELAGWRYDGVAWASPGDGLADEDPVPTTKMELERLQPSVELHMALPRLVLGVSLGFERADFAAVREVARTNTVQHDEEQWEAKLREVVAVYGTFVDARPKLELVLHALARDPRPILADAVQASEALARWDRIDAAMSVYRGKGLVTNPMAYTASEFASLERLADMFDPR
jgi:hypothetical protein